MYNFQIAQRKQKQLKNYLQNKGKNDKWLKRYHTQIKPKLLEQYDNRIKAFIRQIEQQPQDPNKILKINSINKLQPFKFKLYQTCRLKDKKTDKSQLYSQQASLNTLKSSVYIPISQYQFRQRSKQKQIQPSLKLKSFIRRKKRQDSHLRSTHTTRQSKINYNYRKTPKRFIDDNISDIHNLNEDNQSIRYSINENIETQAKQFEKGQQYVQRKKHYKHLANLQQVIIDPIAKKALHALLVKGGIARPKIKSESIATQVDQFKTAFDKNYKF